MKQFSTSSSDVSSCGSFGSTCCNESASKLCHLSLEVGTLSLDHWWSNAYDMVAAHARDGLNSIIILGTWSLWKHHNRYVFDGAAPSLASALLLAWKDLQLWRMAGARGLSSLTTLALED
uniref:Uncharacterized protein n=1 Tax=Arundo donax TaxID=35708 RepID=A0A0A9EKF1_ARUDO